jgi:hypothetical protein
MSLVVVQIKGGLGNQLFCLAAARRLAIVNGAELAVDNVTGFRRDLDYRRRPQLDRFHLPLRIATPAERLEPFSRIRHALRRRANERIDLLRRNYIHQAGMDFEPRILLLRPTGNVYLNGYWQSERYFHDVEATIREDLRIVPPTDSRNIELASQMRECLSVAVHVRFFDQPASRDSDATDTNNAPSDYYRRALARMETIAPGAHYFIFSDDPDAARVRIDLPDSRCTLVAHNRGDENAYADLWLMTQCTHHIIANSTFSWWGAWLAERDGKQVLAPGFEMRHGKAWWGFDGLLPDRWIKL